MAFPDITPELKAAMPQLRGRLLANQSLAELVKSGRITRETAFAHCFRPDDLRRYMQG